MSLFIQKICLVFFEKNSKRQKAIAIHIFNYVWATTFGQVDCYKDVAYLYIKKQKLQRKFDIDMLRFSGKII